MVQGRKRQPKKPPPRTEENSGKLGTKATYRHGQLSDDKLALIRSEKMATFLNCYKVTGRVNESCYLSRVDRTTLRKWQETYPDFVEEYEQAEQCYLESLEKEVHRRGVEGWDEPVYQMGMKVGSKRKYDSTLLLALLKSKKPEYRDGTSVNIANAISNQTTNINGNVTIIEDADWYGNDAHDLAAEASASHAASPVVPGEVQTTGVRKTVEQNGNGDDGGVKRTRKA